MKLPPLIGTLAILPEHVKRCIVGYGRAAQAIATKQDQREVVAAPTKEDYAQALRPFMYSYMQMEKIAREDGDHVCADLYHAVALDVEKNMIHSVLTVKP